MSENVNACVIESTSKWTLQCMKQVLEEKKLSLKNGKEANHFVEKKVRWIHLHFKFSIDCMLHIFLHMIAGSDFIVTFTQFCITMLYFYFSIFQILPPHNADGRRITGFRFYDYWTRHNFFFICFIFFCIFVCIFL